MDIYGEIARTPFLFVTFYNFLVIERTKESEFISEIKTIHLE